MMLNQTLARNFTHRSTASKFQKIVEVIKGTSQDSREITDDITQYRDVELGYTRSRSVSCLSVS